MWMLAALDTSVLDRWERVNVGVHSCFCELKVCSCRSAFTRAKVYEGIFLSKYNTVNFKSSQFYVHSTKLPLNMSKDAFHREQVWTTLYNLQITNNSPISKHYKNAFSKKYFYIWWLCKTIIQVYLNDLSFIGAVLPVYAAGPKKFPGLSEGAAAGGGESSGENLTA